MSRTVLGLDLGSRQDYSALSIVEAAGAPVKLSVPDQDAEYHVERMRTVALEGQPVSFACRFLRRWPLGTSYPAIVGDVIGMARQLSEPILAVDVGGVGVAVGDLFALAGQAYVAVAITAGRQPNLVPGGFTVPKRELVATVQVALQTGRLKIAARLPEAATLMHELEVFDGRLSESGHDTYDARSGQHDDLLLALCLACWTGEQAILEAYIAEWEAATTREVPRVTIGADDDRRW